MTTPDPAGYTLQQAQRDIAQLRGQLVHQAAVAKFSEVILYNASAPPAVSGAAALYAASGSLKYISGLSGDGNPYGTGHLFVINTGQTITNVVGSPATVTNLSVAVANGGTYIFRAMIQFKGGTAAGTATFVLNGPSTSFATSLNYQFVNGAGQTVGSGGAGFTQTQNSPTMNTTSLQLRDEAIFTFSASGSITMTAYTSNAADSIIILGAYFELIPVT